jgi:hypothetical protein
MTLATTTLDPAKAVTVPLEVTAVRFTVNAAVFPTGIVNMSAWSMSAKDAPAVLRRLLYVPEGVARRASRVPVVSFWPNL